MPARERKLTPKQAAACVTREVVADQGGKPVVESRPVHAKEVFDWAELDDGSVVVVTVDGQKLRGKAPESK